MADGATHGAGDVAAEGLPAASEPTLTGSLKKLHGMIDPDQMPERDTVVVMHESEIVRGVLARVLERVLPGFNVDMSASPEDVTAKLAGEVGAKVALALLEIDDTAKNEAVLRPFNGSSRRADFVNVPLVAISQDLPIAMDRHEVSDEQLARLGIDGVLEVPFDQDALRYVVSTTIMKRLEIFEQIEAAKRKEIMTSFLEYYVGLAKTWTSSLEDVSFYPKDTEDLAEPNSKEAILVEIKLALKQLAGQLEEWQRLPNTDLERAGKLSHDIANSLAIPIANFQYLRNFDDIGTSDKNILKIMKDELMFFNSYKGAIDKARKGKTTWSSIMKDRLTLQPVQKLEFPAGTVFCIIDDSPAVLSSCAREIKDRGGVVYTAKNRGELLNVFVANSLPENTVFLLDNDLGRFGNGEGAVYGHELIFAIRERCPKAVIVCHTSDAVDINAKKDNAYKNAGVEVVGKRAWNDLSRVLAYSLAQ